MINSHSLELFIYLIDASPLSKDPRFVVETENGNRYAMDPTLFLAQTHKRFPNRQKILFGQRAARGEANDEAMDYLDTEFPDSPEGEDYVRVVYSKTGNIKRKWRYCIVHI